MKTKDRAGADVAFERLRCAEGAVRLGCTRGSDLSLRDIADPTHRGLRQPLLNLAEKHDFRVGLGRFVSSGLPDHVQEGSALWAAIIADGAKLGKVDQCIPDVAVPGADQALPLSFGPLEFFQSGFQFLVKLPLVEKVRRLLIIEATRKSTIGLGQRLQRRHRIRVHHLAVLPCISPNASEKRHHQGGVGLGEPMRDFDIREREALPVDFAPPCVILAAGHEVGTIQGTVDGYFTFGSATDRADAVSSGGAEPLRLAFIADRADQALAPRTALSAVRAGRKLDYDITSGRAAGV
jgi:hypothetical protein